MCIFSAALIFGAAAAEGQSSVALAPDLTEDQIALVYECIGLTRGSVTESVVPAVDFSSATQGVVEDELIDSQHRTSAYVCRLSDGAGLTVETSNMNRYSSALYYAALRTAGLDNAAVLIAAPYSVSGADGLTAVFAAYEQAGGSVTETDRALALLEMETTRLLLEQTDEYTALAIVNELKGRAGDLHGKTDEQLEDIITSAATQQGRILTSAMMQRLVTLAHAFAEGDRGALTDAADDVSAMLEQLSGVESGSFGAWLETKLFVLSVQIRRTFDDLIDKVLAKL